MKTASNSMPWEANSCEQEILHLLEALLRIALAAEPVLVADHHEAIAGALQLTQRREHAGQQAQLLEAIDLLVRRLLDQGAVAIDEQYRHAAAPLMAQARQQPIVLFRRCRH